MSVVIKTWGKKWLKNSPEKNQHENRSPFHHHRRQNCSQMRCFSKVFRNEQLKISTASKLTFKWQRANSSGLPVVFSPFPLSKLKRMFNIHILGTSLGKCLNIQLKPKADLELAKGRGTRRVADSQVNISLYLKRPDHILKLLLIFMPTSHRPLSKR